MNHFIVPAYYYQHFDADYNLDVPAEGYGGWKKADLPLNPERTAVVVMHAWDCGTREQYPGWFRAVEYIERSYEICKNVFPPLLKAVRSSPLKLFHVVGEGDYYKQYNGYKKALELSGGNSNSLEQIQTDDVLEKLKKFKADFGYPGKHNIPDIERGYNLIDFPPEARPIGDEGIAENADQLFALCKHYKVNHLIYIGFAVNWCMLLSPGGMADMAKRGVMCSVIRQAVTAVENRETARNELCKELALWRISLEFGYIYDIDDFIKAIEQRI